jgi:3-hydroxyacyl-[acyl-carrier-protein] dehydratase
MHRLDLGSNVVALLLPHQRPLVMVDQVGSFTDDGVPELTASRFISANEPIFDGHFPGLHLWPGVFTQEGLGQTCYLLYLIREARRRWVMRGGDAEDVLDGLRNLERGTRLHPGFDRERARVFLEESALLEQWIGVSAAVELKFLRPVFAACRLDYRARLVREIDQHVRFEVEAEVAGTPVARGVLTSFVGYPNPLADLGR